MPSTTSPTYGTWIRTRAIVIFALLTAASCALGLFAFITPWALLLPPLALPFAYILVVLLLARYRFSDSGGQYQRRIHALIVGQVSGDSVLDIGCGNGHLAIQLAKADSSRQVTGLDFWGTSWEYSKATCERNAELEGVAGRVNFVQGSAAELPFPEGSFDVVVSCLTFHEVRDLDDKTLALVEALRVLRPGGTFVLFDLFSSPAPYPHQDLIQTRLKEGGAVEISDSPLADFLPMPFPLNGKRVLKHARLITGRKSTG